MFAKDMKYFESTNMGDKPPRRVKVAPRLYDDLQALDTLFQSTVLPRRPVRPNKSAEALYMFGDASGAGFGRSLKIGRVIHYLHRQWSSSYGKETSNYRELGNLIHAIKDACGKGMLKKAEHFVSTGNSSAESAFFKGTSSSK
jgi:hypothetical protein